MDHVEKWAKLQVPKAVIYEAEDQREKTGYNYPNIKNEACDEILRLKLKKLKPTHLWETGRRVSNLEAASDLYTTKPH